MLLGSKVQGLLYGARSWPRDRFEAALRNAVE